MARGSSEYHTNDSNVVNQGCIEHSHITSNVISQVTGNVTNNVTSHVHHNYALGSERNEMPERELNHHFGVPYSLCTYFTGRREVLRQLERHLVEAADQDAYPRTICTLHGLGGAGKTQITIKFAEVYRDKFWGIFWIDAHSDSTAWQSLQKIARIAKVDRGQDVKEDAQQAKSWLASQRKRWLLVIDGADDPNVNVNNYMPPGGFGCLLITTRNPYLVGTQSQFHIADLPIQDSIDLLIKTASGAKQIFSESDIYQATEIVKELGCLALAIVQAGCAIRNKRCQLDDYLEEFRRNQDDLMKRPAVQGTEDEKRTVYATWMVSRTMIQELGSSQSSDALDILDISALFYHGDIPLEIFGKIDPRGEVESEWMPWMFDLLTRRMSRPPPDESKPVWPRSRLKSALSLLSSYSLVDFDDTRASFSLHKLVHAWVGYHLRNELGIVTYRWARLSASRGIARLVNTLNRGLADFEFRRRLYPHINHYLGHDTQLRPLQIYVTEDAEILSKFACVLEESGCYEKARGLYNECSTYLERALGREHSLTLSSLNDLGSVLERLGRYDESDKIHSRVLTARKKLLGLDHALTLQSVHNKTLALQGKGDIREAMGLNEDLLRRRKAALGNDDIATIEAISRQASLCMRDGKYRQAAGLARDALELRRKKLGESHRDTLASIDNLVLILEYEGSNWDEAEKMSRKAAEMRIKSQGVDHPETLSSMSTRARLLWKRGMYEKSREIHMTVHARRSQLLGPTHPDTLFTLSYLAEDSRRRGDLGNARKLLEKALLGLEQQLGEDHSQILVLKSNLAVIYRQEQKLEEAEEMYRDTLGKHHRSHGRSHPDALLCILNLATLLREKGDLAGAEEYAREAVAGFRAKHGQQHPDTLTGLYVLAKILQKSEKYEDLEEAEQLAREAYQGRTSLLGPDHLDTLDIGALLAHILHRRGRLYEAREQYAKVCGRYLELGESPNGKEPWYFKYFQMLETELRKLAFSNTCG